MVHLVGLDDNADIPLSQPVLLVGRVADCDVQLQARTISRRHCCIAQVNDYLVVRDLGSTNGIRINGSQVLEGRLHPDDELMIGSLRYRVAAGPAAPEQPSTARSSRRLSSPQPALPASALNGAPPAAPAEWLARLDPDDPLIDHPPDPGG